jgi:hypothetical protein
MVFSFNAVRTHWAVTFPVILSILFTLPLIFLLIFYILASLPSRFRTKLRFPWKYSAKKRTVMFISQVTSIPFAIGASLCVLFSYFVEKQDQNVPACDGLQVGTAFFSLTLELLQTIFLLQKSSLTKNVWEKGFLRFHKLLSIYVLLTNPTLIILMMVYIRGAWISSDDGLVQVCGGAASAEVAGTFALNTILVNGSLFTIFYKSIKNVSASAAAGAQSRTSTGNAAVAEKQARLMTIGKRNLVSFYLICFSQLLFLFASLVPGGDLGLITAAYLPFHFLATNLVILYCTQAAWKKKGLKVNKTPAGSALDKNQNVSTSPTPGSVSPNQSHNRQPSSPGDVEEF